MKPERRSVTRWKRILAVQPFIENERIQPGIRSHRAHCSKTIARLPVYLSEVHFLPSRGDATAAFIIMSRWTAKHEPFLSPPSFISGVSGQNGAWHDVFAETWHGDACTGIKNLMIKSFHTSFTCFMLKWTQDEQSAQNFSASMNFLWQRIIWVSTEHLSTSPFMLTCRERTSYRNRKLELLKQFSIRSSDITISWWKYKRHWLRKNMTNGIREYTFLISIWKRIAVLIDGAAKEIESVHAVSCGIITMHQRLFEFMILHNEAIIIASLVQNFDHINGTMSLNYYEMHHSSDDLLVPSKKCTILTVCSYHSCERRIE